MKHTYNVPVLGICVGMQIMANRSAEGSSSGLGWISGEVELLTNPSLSANLRIPHMGWNNITPNTHPLFYDISDPQFYFLHSYCFVPDSPKNIMASAEYGQTFAAAVFNGDILGVQFHPEKSHHWGIKLLKNFACLNS